MSQGPDIAAFDAIVVGAGSGGLTVAVGLATFDKQVLLLERNQIGGDCTNVGCIPSKALLHQTLHRNGRTSAEILETVRNRRDALRDGELEEYQSYQGIRYHEGSGRVCAGGVVEITDPDGTVWQASADNVILATGSSPRRLSIEGLPADRAITNDELFELSEAPARLVIVGAGPIGMEMAVAFGRLGSRVVVLESAPQILPGLLPEAAAVVGRSLEAAGVELRPGLVAKSFDPATSQLRIGPLNGTDSGPSSDSDDAADCQAAHDQQGNLDETIENVDLVLLAAGRVANITDLGLEALGIATERGRIVIDNKGQTSTAGVWAVGDVTTQGATSHGANAWGRRVLRHIVAPYAPAGDRPLHPSVTFTEPEVATIGSQPSEVPADVRRLVHQLSDSDRAFTDDVADGIIIVDVRRLTGVVLGATIVGPRAAELISIFSLAMKNGIPFHKWYGTVWPYPSYADALGAVVDDYMTDLLHNRRANASAWARARIKRWLPTR